MPIVLLVEDDPDVRKMIEMVLIDRGLEVRSVEDDRAAQRVLDKEAAQIAVLIADVNLGARATGFDVARKARRLNPRVEVVYITGEAQAVDQLGVDGGVLLPKPFNIVDLGELVAALANLD
jgi:DNA-binding response OmpR family regulator